MNTKITSRESGRLAYGAAFLWHPVFAPTGYCITSCYFDCVDLVKQRFDTLVCCRVRLDERHVIAIEAGIKKESVIEG